jgi:hypothetical protein
MQESAGIQWTDEQFLTSAEMKAIDVIASTKALPEWTLVMFDKTSHYAIVSNLTSIDSIEVLSDILKAMTLELSTPNPTKCDA